MRIIVPDVVHYGVAAAQSTGDPRRKIERYRAMASEMGIDAQVQLCVCRRETDVYRLLLPEHSTIVIGGRRRQWPWPNATQRAAEALERLGHRVMTADGR